MTSLKEREELYRLLYQKMKKRRKNKNFSIIFIFDKSIPFEQEQYKNILEIQGECIPKKIYSKDNYIALQINDKN